MLTRVRARRLLEGGTLWDHLERCKRMPECDVCVVARRLLETLAAMADVGVSHVDVKPLNMGLAKPRQLESTTLFDMGSWRRIGETLPAVLLVAMTACRVLGRDVLVIRDWRSPDLAWSVASVLNSNTTPLLRKAKRAAPRGRHGPRAGRVPGHRPLRVPGGAAAPHGRGRRLRLTAQ